jgi:hypothetical protein
MRSIRAVKLKDMKTVSQKDLSSKDSKLPKIVKSSSSTKDYELETLHRSKKGGHTVIESHEDSDETKTKTSSKVFF